MSRISDHHVAKCGVEGKCSVPMWQGGLPGGFCDRPAWGEQFAFGSGYEDPSWLRPGQWAGGGGRQKPYAPGLACDHHGGPRADQVRFVRDGNMWCAFMPDFINLAESRAGFGETQARAEKDLRAALSRALGEGERS